MFPPPLHHWQVLQFALRICIPSSIIVHFLVILLAKSGYTWTSSDQAKLLFFLVASIIMSSIKILATSAVSYLYKPAWRRTILLASAIILTCLEGVMLYVLYELWNSSAVPVTFYNISQ